ncbi:SEC-C metal-binding domain-containing protein [Flavobacterium coralii]|uniref:SEC-C metal-binding domain-containing protein n=1 Tax=Flavobacterium coralii TaxID=2838017 RepID=UPI000C4E09F7|nr:hypothetical protein [Flavobacterium sp.]|tara:strand:- start:41337 stop:41975 length:639 start_codon:yes stop_codon:yes gene_type:complete
MNQHFQNELSIVVNKFPNLAVKSLGQEIYLRGILDVPNDNGDIVGSFLIEIHSVEKFPYRFPKLYEVGGEIPVHPDWHKYNDNSCCLTVEPDELIICRHGITLSYFIESIAIPYFANQLYRKAEGKYFNEYPHGYQGLYVFYAELFNNKDISVWLEYLKRTFSGKKAMRNDKCYCASGKKFKYCHMKTEEKLRVLGRTRILNDIQDIITSMR